MRNSFQDSGVIRGQYDEVAQQRIDQIRREIAQLIADGAILAVQPNQAGWVYAVEISGGSVDLVSAQVIDAVQDAPSTVAFAPWATEHQLAAKRHAERVLAMQVTQMMEQAVTV